MRIRVFTGGVFGENGYLVTCSRTGATVVVDPGAAAGGMVDAVVREGLELHAVLLTHAHLDHVEGVHVIREISEAPIHLHPADRGIYDALPQQAAAFGLEFTPQPPPDRELAHGERYTFGACGFDVRFAPGHAPGHVVFVAEEHGVALVGDVVFQGAVGRTDLPGGHLGTLMTSIREQILTLPDSTRLLTGHGPETTVGEERVGNPFLIAHHGGRLA